MVLGWCVGEGGAVGEGEFHVAAGLEFAFPVFGVESGVVVGALCRVRDYAGLVVFGLVRGCGGLIGPGIIWVV